MPLYNMEERNEIQWEKQDDGPTVLPRIKFPSLKEYTISPFITSLLDIPFVSIVKCFSSTTRLYFSL